MDDGVGVGIFGVDAERLRQPRAVTGLDRGEAKARSLSRIATKADPARAEHADAVVEDHVIVRPAVGPARHRCFAARLVRAASARDPVPVQRFLRRPRSPPASGPRCRMPPAHESPTFAAAASESVGQLPRQLGRKIGVVGRHQPGHRHARAFAEFGRRRDQRVRRADLVGKIVGMAAAPRRECDDGRDALRVLAGQRQRPGAGRVPDEQPRPSCRMKDCPRR